MVTNLNASMTTRSVNHDSNIVEIQNMKLCI